MLRLSAKSVVRFAEMLVGIALLVFIATFLPW